MFSFPSNLPFWLALPRVQLVRVDEFLRPFRSSQKLETQLSPKEEEMIQIYLFSRPFASPFPPSLYVGFTAQIITPKTSHRFVTEYSV